MHAKINASRSFQCRGHRASSSFGAIGRIASQREYEIRTDLIVRESTNIPPGRRPNIRKSRKPKSWWQSPARHIYRGGRSLTIVLTSLYAQVVPDGKVDARKRSTHIKHAAFAYPQHVDELIRTHPNLVEQVGSTCRYSALSV